MSGILNLIELGIIPSGEYSPQINDVKILTHVDLQLQ